MSYVNIVTSDRGWILEKLATEITSRLPYVVFGGAVDSHADIQYYITYSCRFDRVSPVEVAYFAHLEPEGEAREKFFNVAQSVDYCTTHAQLYASMLQDYGVSNVRAISPGVDLEHFTPKIRIGVVGRTYHTGRKGEHIVAQVMDIPEIEWSFTGDGWPEPGLHLPAEALPDFYRHLDYVLVPALYEGGPMCVVEALACGTEVIAPAVGWVPEFPHIEYRVGDAADLRRILLDIVEKKRALRETVLTRTWDTWAESHDVVFHELAQRHNLKLATPARAQIAPEPDKIGLFMHGSEGKSPGGPTVRVPRLARELNQLGLQASVQRFPRTDLATVDIVHGFNVWAPDSALDLVRRAKLAGRQVVFSPIYLDLSLRHLWQDQLPVIFEASETPAQLDAGLERFQEACDEARSGTQAPLEPVPGFHAAVQEMIELSDHVIFLSEREKQRLERIGAVARHGTVVANPVDHQLFASADPELFKAEFGVSDFVLCVARQETRKNQLMLLHALKDTNIPIVLIGHAASANYRKLIERYATPNVRMIERLPPNSPLLASAFAAARVSVLPSWAEGAPLAALEAAAAGASLVLSDESGESEYFGERARYADPASSSALRTAIMQAYESPRTPEQIESQKAFIAETYNWTRHRDSTREVYRTVYASASIQQSPPIFELSATPAIGPMAIVYDVTTSANHKGRWTGIARVEAALALALKEHPLVSSIHFVAWNNKAQSFIEIPFDAIRSGKTSTLLGHYDATPTRSLALPQNAHYIVPGSGWMQNSGYAEGIVAFKHRYNLRLTPIIHDVIPIRFPFWFNDGYAPVFSHNLAVLLGNADQIMAISQWTKSDIEHFANITPDIFIPRIDVFREGDQISLMPARNKPSAMADTLGETSFVICVGAIHQRKNHKLLYDVWVKLVEKMGRRCPKLVIVGGVAWNGEDLARALRTDARVKDYVVILDNIDDSDLSWLYNNCLFTVYPSLYEGWGLPVAESLRHGKLCIASNASSVPEIAPDFVELLDPLDPNAWIAKIQFYAGSKLARDQREAAIAKDYRGFTWAESAETLVQAMGAAASTRRPDRLYTPGRVIGLSDRIQSARIKRAGWHLTERWGCWTSRPNAALEFELPSPFTGPVVLIAEVQALLFPGSPSDTRILINGVPMGRWVLDRADLQVRTVLIPSVPPGNPKTLRVEFENASITPIARISKSADTRSVGIGVGRIAVASAASVQDAAEYFGPPKDETRRVRLGVEYSFLKNDKIRTCLEGQWATNSVWGVFNTNKRPLLHLAIQEAPAEDLTIEFFLRSVASEDNPLTLIVLVNDIQCGSWTFTDDQVQRIAVQVPLSIRQLSDPMMIDLVPSDTNSPKSIGIGALEEEFGFGLVSMSAFAKTTPPRSLLPIIAGERFALSAASRAEATFDLTGPWHGLEKNGIWSFGGHARLPLKLPKTLSGDLLVKLEISAFAPQGSFTTVQVAANGVSLPSIEVAGGTPEIVSLVVPRTALNGRRSLILDLVSARASSPFKQGTGADERILGLRLRSVTVAEAPLLLKDRIAFFGVGNESPRTVSADPLVQGEWYPAERVGRWSRGRGGQITMMVDPSHRTTGRLFMVARPVGAAISGMVMADLKLGNTATDRWIFRNDAWTFGEVQGFALASEATANPVLELRPVAPRSPRDLGIGKDSRLLGLMVRALVLVGEDEGEAHAQALFRAADIGFDTALNRDPPAFITTSAITHLSEMLPASEIEKADPETLLAGSDMLIIGTDSRAEDFLIEGWFGTEPEGVWGHASKAHLRLDTLPIYHSHMFIRLLARVFGTDLLGPATAIISANGHELARLHFADDSFHWITLAIDAAAFGGRPPALTFQRIAPISPAQAQSGDDIRMLGVFLKAISIAGLDGQRESPEVQHADADKQLAE